MYRQRLTEEVKDAIKRGHMPTLIATLKASDKQLVEDLKKTKDDHRFLQGAALVIDELIKLLDA